MIFLKLGERRLEAHRIVLSAASDYFAAMFTNDFGESNQNEIELQGVDPDALETLVTYCYTGNFILHDSFIKIWVHYICYDRWSRTRRRYCRMPDGDGLFTSVAGSGRSLFDFFDTPTSSVQLSRHSLICR